jgi:hypothetical protein
MMCTAGMRRGSAASFAWSSVPPHTQTPNVTSLDSRKPFDFIVMETAGAAMQ